jgi:hypothetical protein
MQASGQKGTTRYVPNGPISPDHHVRLACAIRWFAGGSPYDIMTTYGIGHTDTINIAGMLWMPSTDIQGLTLRTQTITIGSDI